MSTLTLTAAETVAITLHRVARRVSAPMNASLPEALRLATRDPQLARAAVEQLAATLSLHPRDLPLWDVTRTRTDVAAILRIAARRTR
jgi:hypothetical protein